VLKDAMLRCPGPVLSREDLTAVLRQATRPNAPSGADAGNGQRDIVEYIRSRLAAGTTNLHAEALAHLEAHLIREVLAHTSGNQVQAAKILGIARNSLRKKISAFSTDT
jgi:two-component system, NtrC family, response regulator AtoC